MSSCKAIVLAAGRGVRMGADVLPKVMRSACDRPLLAYVLRALSFLPASDIVIVVGYQKETVMSAFGPKYTYAEQVEQLGTGHAVLVAHPALADYSGPVIIACGDMPLIRPATYRTLLETHVREQNALTLLMGRSTEQLSYGHVILSSDGRFERIVEEQDCTAEQKKSEWLNAGLYVVEADRLFPTLHTLSCDNAQKEYYLTDVPGLLAAQGERVGVLKSLIPEELLGVNTPQQLEHVEYRIREANLLF